MACTQYASARLFPAVRRVTISLKRSPCHLVTLMMATCHPFRRDALSLRARTTSTRLLTPWTLVITSTRAAPNHVSFVCGPIERQCAWVLEDPYSQFGCFRHRCVVGIGRVAPPPPPPPPFSPRVVASNYHPAFTVDDGSCRYDIYGCAVADALNYDTLATVSTGCIHLVIGCTDSIANNFAADANRNRDQVRIKSHYFSTMQQCVHNNTFSDLLNCAE